MANRWTASSVYNHRTMVGPKFKHIYQKSDQMYLPCPPPPQKKSIYLALVN
eukprot:c3702_g1_i1 orf=1-150(-)